MDADEPLEDDTIIAAGLHVPSEAAPTGAEDPADDATRFVGDIGPGAGAEETRMVDDATQVASGQGPAVSPPPLFPAPPPAFPAPPPAPGPVLPEPAPDRRGTVLERHLGPPPPPAPVGAASREQLPSLHRRERRRRRLTLAGLAASVVISGAGLWGLWLLW